MNRDTASRLGAPILVGFLVGALTAGGAYALYPPSREHVWPISVLAVGSVLSILTLYVGSVRLGLLRVADSLVVGYGLALVLAASLVVTEEFVHALRAHVPENLGVKRVALSHVQVPG